MDVQLAFIGFGEAAQAFVKGWDAAGVRANLPPIKAYDVKTDAAATRDAKHADYARWAVAGHDGPADALHGADVVMSLVTADQALVAARAAAEHVKPDALFFDGNSCSPGAKRDAAHAIEAAGGRYVDMAIMAPVHPALHKVAVLLSGPHAQRGVDALQGLDMQPRVAEGPVGTASSLKMVRSVMVKGLEALVLECVLAGRKAGVDAAVLDSLDATYPGFDWKGRAAYMMERVTTHGVRRAAEMREVAKTVEELGLEAAMTRGAVDWQQRIGDLRLGAPDGDYGARADAILAALNGDAPVKANANAKAKAKAGAGE